MPALAKSHIDGLVTWRALLMLGGLLLHATTGQENYPPFAVINIVSGSFRTGAFFMISGLLTGLALTRHADGLGWLERRMLQLALPTLFGILLLCPAIYLLARATETQAPLFSLYHLWFMIALVDYTLIAWFVHRIDMIYMVFERLTYSNRTARLPQSVLLVGTGTLSFLLMLQLAAMTARWSGDHASLLRQLPLIVGYAPTFLLGLACGRVPALRHVLIDRVRVPLAIIAAAVAGHLGLQFAGPALLAPSTHADVEQLLLLAGAAWCPPAAAALILRSAIGIRGVPPLLRRLSAASLTMYLLHFPLMITANAIIRPFAPSPWIGFAVSLIVGGGLSYLIHVEVVERSRWAMLIVNGRIRRVPNHAATRAALMPASS